MGILDYFSRRNRLRRKILALVDNKDKIAITPDIGLLMVHWLQEVYLDQEIYTEANQWQISFFFTPEVLKRRFDEGSRMIMEEIIPEREFGIPRSEASRLVNWLYDSNDMSLDYEDYFKELLKSAEEFLTLSRDSFETEGRMMAEYRFHQMFFPLCDLFNITEAFVDRR